MKSDTVVQSEGMQILFERLGLVDAERFVALISREPFDYTEWRQDLDEGLSVRDTSKKAMAYQKTLTPLN